MFKLNLAHNAKVTYGILLAFALLILALFYGHYHWGNGAKPPPPIPVETTAVRVGPLDHTLPAIGILQSNESIIVRPEVSGRVAQIHFTEGQAVEKGQPLVSLEDSIAQANLKESEAEYKLRKLEFSRAETLLQRSAGSITDKDTALTKLEVGEASLAKAQSMLAKMNITAAFEGYVGMRKVNIGDFVTVGQDLVNLVDLDPIKLDFRIPEVYLEQVKLGQNVDVVTDALPDKKFIGKIYAIDPQVDPIGHSILVRAIIDNKSNILRPGLFARIQIVLEHLDNSLFVPAEALMPQEQKQFVFRVEKDNTVALTEVTVGERRLNEVEILKGLKAGDIVVTAGQMKINPGSKITQKPNSLVIQKKNEKNGGKDKDGKDDTDGNQDGHTLEPSLSSPQ